MVVSHATVAASVNAKLGDQPVVTLTSAGVVVPIGGGLIRLNVPPKVKLPVVVTVPVRVKPLTVPVPATEVTVPVAGVVQVGAAADPPDVNTCPDVPKPVVPDRAGVVPRLVVKPIAPEALMTCED